MNIIKESEITVRSVIDNLDSAGLPEGESEVTESRALGYLHILDGITLITYVECAEDGTETTTEIKCEGDTVRVLRRGAIESDIMLTKGVTHASLYSVVPYKFDIEVTAKKIRSSLGESGGRLDLIYDMTIGGAKKSIRMKIDVLAK